MRDTLRIALAHGDAEEDDSLSDIETAEHAHIAPNESALMADMFDPADISLIR